MLKLLLLRSWRVYRVDLRLDDESWVYFAAAAIVSQLPSLPRTKPMAKLNRQHLLPSIHYYSPTIADQLPILNPVSFSMGHIHPGLIHLGAASSSSSSSF